MILRAKYLLPETTSARISTLMRPLSFQVDLPRPLGATPRLSKTRRPSSYHPISDRARRPSELQPRCSLKSCKPPAGNYPPLVEAPTRLSKAPGDLAVVQTKPTFHHPTTHIAASSITWSSSNNAPSPSSTKGLLQRAGQGLGDDPGDSDDSDSDPEHDFRRHPDGEPRFGGRRSCIPSVEWKGNRRLTRERGMLKP